MVAQPNAHASFYSHQKRLFQSITTAAIEYSFTLPALTISLILSIILIQNAQLFAGPLSSCTKVTAINVDTPIDPGRSDNIGAFWTFSSLRSFALSPSPNGESKVGWQDSGGNIRVTPLTDSDQRKANDIIVGQGKLYDLVAHNNGFAILVMRNNRMYIEKFNETGTNIFSVELTDADDRVDSWHTGKLDFNGTRYSAYFAIHGTSGWTEGHEGDKLKYISQTGSIETGGWEWGCSHSMDQRLINSGSSILPLCVSDCYPGKGIYLNNNYLLSEADGDCSGGTNARFGAAASAEDHGVLVYLSIDNRSQWDVIFDSFSGSAPYTNRTERALTNTTGQNEINPKIVPYAPGTFLVSWESSGGGMRIFQLIDLDGTPLTPPEPVDVYAGPVNDFKLFPNGDIGWAYAWDSMSELKIVRILRGDVNGDKATDLKDVITGLKIAAGISDGTISTAADISGDLKIGLEEVLFILTRVSES